MVVLRRAKLEDVEQIQQVEKEYYEGFSCPKEMLESWIKGLSENFVVAEENNKIVAFIFFEYLNEVEAIPFFHELKHDSSGKYVYVSEVGVLDEFQNSDILQRLLDKTIKKARSDGCKAVVWLTGSKSKHDKIETNTLLNNSFTKKRKVKRWEAYPNHFVSDHCLWIKEI